MIEPILAIAIGLGAHLLVPLVIGWQGGKWTYRTITRAASAVTNTETIG